ncbi:MAG: polyprenyl synthetase family protein [Flavobacteriales bacterium]|nr:polyprenyl synthetase family protein [Flavobacteriales bacterium]
MTLTALKNPADQLLAYRDAFNNAIPTGTVYKIAGLYDPIDYLMQLGGKRIRPAMVLAAAEAFGASQEKAMDVALAVETFHNFTLMHDDIMDKAPLRRGMPTVHEKWNANTAILSGDAMLVQAYQHLSKSDPAQLPELMKLFNHTAIEVCEGQQLDMEFETRDNVTVDEYMEMIELKTSVLLAAALKMGAIIAGASEEDQAKIYSYGIKVGLAFQLQDDYLDAFGDPEKFGKQVGGDILADKKTFLYLMCQDLASAEQLKSLKSFHGVVSEEKVAVVKDLFESTGASAIAKKEMNDYYNEALSLVDELNCSEEGKLLFRFLAEMVLVRTT